VKIGIFSDVHGDYESLLRVWNEFEELGLSEGIILNAGDNVTYGKYPEECVQFLRCHRNVITVRGNYDKTVALFGERASHYKKKWKLTRPEKYKALVRDHETISDDARAWLRGLPTELELLVEGFTITLTHYSPGSKKGLGTWTSKAEFARVAETTESNIVVCGHTHTPFIRQAGKVTFINPGAIGRSWYGHPQYAILTLEAGKSPQAELKQV
jgi:putative phosphoesterase